MSSNLLAASRALVDALASGDLDAAERAIEARAAALGEAPCEEAIALGDQAVMLLEGVKRQAALEASHLERASRFCRTDS